MCGRRIDAEGRLQKEVRLAPSQPGGDINPVMCTDSRGTVCLGFQRWTKEPKGGFSGFTVFKRYQDGSWDYESSGYTVGWNAWYPAVAAAPGETVALAQDVYQDFLHTSVSYDVTLTVLQAPNKVGTRTIVGSPKFEARPSIVYDRDGRLWIAYEEGPEKWGKDYGSLVPDRGNPLYSARSVRVVCIDTDGKPKRPVAELPTSTVVPPQRSGDALVTHKFESGSALRLSEDRPRRQGARLGDLSPQLRLALQRPIPAPTG